jgi:uncharacterized protein (DUF1800 family)
LDKIDPLLAWKPWEPDAKQPWDLKWAGHLYRRAGFGATHEELLNAVHNGLSTTLKSLFEGDPQRAARDRALAKEGVVVARKGDVLDLRGWWVERMLQSGQPLREKMTLFWHNHFATSLSKVQSTALMHRQNELLRRHALGKFEPLLLDVSKDPAMLVWLDSNSNVVGKPNENYARELMELFSLGVGNYTEKDVREAARAFTGWHHTDGKQFSFAAALHDPEEKTVLGQTGPWDGDDVVRLVLKQPAAARFLVRKLYRFFISEAHKPPDALLKPLADRFRDSDYDVGAVVKTILGSRHFFSAHAYRQRIKSPVEFVLGAVRALAGNLVKPRALAVQMELLGQHLFAPPNVKGWEGGTSWLNTATVVARHNFAYALALGGGALNLAEPDPTRSAAVAVDPSSLARRLRLREPEDVVALYVDLLLQGDLSQAARKRLVAFVEEGPREGPGREQRVREMIHALLTVPEHQLA